MDIVLRQGQQLFATEGKRLVLVASVEGAGPMVVKDFQEPGLVVTWERGNISNSQVINKPK